MAGKTVFNVQALRGIAALMVAAYHLQAMLNAVWGTTLEFHFGSFGVDIFFVVSGFVMYYSNDRIDRPVLPFMVARFFRIVPLYWLATLVIVLFYQLGFHPNGLMVFEPSMLLESLLFIRSHFPDGRYDLILPLGWTLIYELFFYLVFALSFRAGTAGRSLALVSLVFVLLIAIGLAMPDLPPNIAYFTSPIILEFLMGGALALLIRRHDRAGRALPAWTTPLSAVAILAGCCGVIALEIIGGTVPGAARGLVWGPLAFLIVASAVVLEKTGRSVRNRNLLLLGATSYMLYLFHPVVMQPVSKLVAYGLPVQGPAGAGIAAIAALVAAILFATVVHLKIELQVLRVGRDVVSRMGDVRSSPKPYPNER